MHTISRGVKKKIADPAFDMIGNHKLILIECKLLLNLNYHPSNPPHVYGTIHYSSPTVNLSVISTHLLISPAILTPKTTQCNAIMTLGGK